MIAWMLTALNQDPTFIAGGVLANLGVNARVGKGSTFVIEADEYDRMFLDSNPPSRWLPTSSTTTRTATPPGRFSGRFMEFVHHLPTTGTLIACAEDPGAYALLAKAEKMGKAVLAYGLKPTASDGRGMETYTSVLSVNGKGGFTFSACVLGNSATVELQVPGKHNILNALAALTVAQLLGLPLADAAQALGQFAGTGRRFESEARRTG